MGGIARQIFVTVLVTVVGVTSAQFFDPILDDHTYLDNIEKNVAKELEEAKSQLVAYAGSVENITRSYIASKLKENVFNALRMMAENELAKAESKSGSHSLFQKEDQDQEPGSPDGGQPELPLPEDEDEDEATTKGTTPLTGLGTAVKVNQQVFSFLGEAFKIIFAGGKPKVKKANSVDPAQLLIDEPKDMQILGAVSLLAQDAMDFNPALIAITHPKNVQGPSKKTKKGAEDEDLDEDSNDPIVQDARIINLFKLLGLGRKKSGANKGSSASGSAAKNETLSGFDEDTKPKGSGGSKPSKLNLEKFVKNFRKSLGELQSSVPDIYRGVREAYKLLETVRGVAEKVEDFLEETFRRRK